MILGRKLVFILIYTNLACSILLQRNKNPKSRGDASVGCDSQRQMYRNQADQVQNRVLPDSQVPKLPLTEGET